MSSVNAIINGQTNIVYSTLDPTVRTQNRHCVICKKAFKKADRVHQLACSHIHHRGCLNARFAKHESTCGEKNCRGKIVLASLHQTNATDHLYISYPEEAIAFFEDRMTRADALSAMVRKGMDLDKATGFIDSAMKAKQTKLDEEKPYKKIFTPTSKSPNSRIQAQRIQILGNRLEKDVHVVSVSLVTIFMVALSAYTFCKSQKIL